jgi:hypothetical protein
MGGEYLGHRFCQARLYALLEPDKLLAGFLHSVKKIFESKRRAGGDIAYSGAFACRGFHDRGAKNDSACRGLTPDESLRGAHFLLRASYNVLYNGFLYCRPRPTISITDRITI